MTIPIVNVEISPIMVNIRFRSLKKRARRSSSIIFPINACHPILAVVFGILMNAIRASKIQEAIDPGKNTTKIIIKKTSRASSTENATSFFCSTALFNSKAAGIVINNVISGGIELIKPT